MHTDAIDVLPVERVFTQDAVRVIVSRWFGVEYAIRVNVAHMGPFHCGPCSLRNQTTPLKVGHLCISDANWVGKAGNVSDFTWSRRGSDNTMHTHYCVCV